MTKKEQKKYLESFKDYKKSVLSTKESAEKFLRKTGIITESGRLSSNYK